MELVIEKIGDVAAVAVQAEELDASNASDLKRDIAPVLQANTKVVLDLIRVRFMDSSGLGAMLSCLRQLTTKKGDLKLCGMSKQVRGAFELVHLHKIFDIYPSRAEAVLAFQSKPAGVA
jgi:anti-sigma B factor antagonist